MIYTMVPVMVNGCLNRQKTLAELKRAKVQCVALTIVREYPEFSSKSTLENLSDLISFFRTEGFEICVWLGETFGHSAKPVFQKHERYTYLRMVDKWDINSFCPLDDNFIEDMQKWITDIAKLGPDKILLDDDFRLGYRDGGIGCCCSLHMAKFNAYLGETITEEELRDKVFTGKGNKYRDAWMKVQGESMENIALKLRESVDKINPNIAIGRCNSLSSWDSEGSDTFKIAKILAGKNQPFHRLTGAPYWSNLIGVPLGEVVEMVRTELYWCKDSGVKCFAEGDTWPRPRQTCPASKLECFNQIVYADGKCNSILKYMLDYVSDADYETGYIDAHVKNQKTYEQIERLFKDKIGVGVRIYNVKSIFKNAELKEASDRTYFPVQTQHQLFQPSSNFVALNNIPSSFDGNGVNILFGENARYITEEELKNGNIIDAEAVKILMERGIDVGVDSIIPYGENGSIDNIINYAAVNHIKSGEKVRQGGLNVKFYKIKRSKNTQLLTEYVFDETVIPGIFTYENKEGMKFIVMPYDAFTARNEIGVFNSYAIREDIIDVITNSWGKPFKAVVKGRHPNLYTLVKENETSLAIGCWNLFEDYIDNLTIVLDKEYENVRFVNCEGSINGKTITIKSRVYPYEFVGIECLYK